MSGVRGRNWALVSSVEVGGCMAMWLPIVEPVVLVGGSHGTSGA